MTNEANQSVKSSCAQLKSLKALHLLWQTMRTMRNVVTSMGCTWSSVMTFWLGCLSTY